MTSAEMGAASDAGDDADLRESLIAVLRSRRGVIRGVAFELDHPKLPNGWLPSHAIGFDTAFGRGSDEPWLIFPWSLWADSHEIRRNSGATRVFPGDVVRIERVEMRQIGPEILPPADRYVVEARLIVDRKSGRKTRVPVPLRYYPRNSLQRPGRDGRPTYEVVLGRACSENGIASLDEYKAAPVDPEDETQIPLRVAALEAAVSLEYSTKSLFDQIAEPEGDSSFWLQMKFEAVINDAVALGYYTAAAEADAFMALPAMDSAEQRRRRQHGARVSRKMRADKARVRKSHAQHLIRSFLAQPSLHPPKAEAVAKFVKDAWDRKDVAAPSRSTTMGYLSEMRRNGELA